MCHFFGDFLLGDYEIFQQFSQTWFFLKNFFTNLKFENHIKKTHTKFGLKNGLKVTQSVNDIKKLNEQNIDIFIIDI